MDRRSFLKVGGIAASGAVATTGRASLLESRSQGRGFVEFAVPGRRVASQQPSALGRRSLIGLAAVDDESRRRQARLVVAGAMPGEPAAAAEPQAHNDRLAELCRRRPGVVSALALLPSRRSAAARELERCVAQLGLSGGTIQVETALPRDAVRACAPAFEAADSLRVPLHIAPAEPPYYGWSAAVASALIDSGCLERFRALILIIDPVDDELPFWLAGVDRRWSEHGRRSGMPPSEQLRRVVFTTGGLNYHPALPDLVRLIGRDRVLYASDQPFAYDPEFVAAAMPLPADDITHIMRRNAERLFRLA